MYAGNHRAKRLILNSMEAAHAEGSTVRQQASVFAAWGARGCFGAALILIPLRYRWVLLPRPLTPIYSDYTDFLLYAADVAILLTLALWLISLLLAPREITLGPRHVWIPLAGLTLAGWLSTLSSYDAQLSIYHAIRLLVLYWFYVFVVNELFSRAWLVFFIGLQVASESVVAVAQFIAQHSVHLQTFGELPLDPAASGVSVVVSGGSRLLRAYGLTDHPNLLGGCLAFGLVLLLPSCLRASRKWPAAAAAFILGIQALLVSFSRAAWLAFTIGALAILLMEILHRRWTSIQRGAWLALACLTLISSLLLAYAQFFGVRLNSGNSFSSPTAEQQSVGERVILLKLAMPILRDHPLTGVGLGGSPLALHAYYPAFTLNYEPPHWSLFDAALETGVLGAISYLALLVFPVLVFIRRRDLWSHPILTTALALLLAITVVGFFDYYTWLLDPGRIWQWLGWGLWAVALEKFRT